jgi:hypothetical protein
MPILLFAGESTSSRQIVFEVYPKWYSQESFTLQGNIGIKKVLQAYDWVTYYAKPSVTYALSHNMALHGGLGMYYTDNKTVNDTEELRPFIGVSHFTNFTENWGISSYFRAEERYQYTMGNDNRSDTTRLRLRFRNSYKLNALSTPNAWHKMTLDLEGFKSYKADNSVQPSYDYETRVTLGAERSLGEQKKIRFELAWKYKSPPTKISDSAINTIFFKIQYFPSWGSRIQNRLRDRDIDE